MLKCQLADPVRNDYDVRFTDAQWSRLKDVFADGVCDWSRRSVGHQDSIPWLTFLDVDGSAIPGGTPLGPAPVSVAFGPSVATEGTLPATGGGAVSPVALALLLVAAATTRRAHRIVTRSR